MENTEVLIIGGGVSGLSAAWWLARSGIAVELWEREDGPGGLIATRLINGYRVERAASLMVNSSPAVSEFLEHAGLAANKIPVTAGSARYLLHDGSLVPVPMRPGALLFAPFWSMRGRLRLLAEPLIPRGGQKNETVSAFISRRLGREALEKAFEPLIACTYASDPDQANARAVLQRLTALEDRFGSLALGILAHKLRGQGPAQAVETFSFRGGMEALVRSLALAPGVRFRAAHSALRIEREDGYWRAIALSPHGECSVRARHIVLSVPAPDAAGLLEPVDGRLAALVRGIEYAPLAIVHFGMDRHTVAHRLNGMGFLVPRGEKLPFLGCQWVSSLFPERAPPGKVAIATYLGGARDPRVLKWDDQRIAQTAFEHLKPLLGLGGAPEMVHVERHRKALPTYCGAYPDRAQAIHAGLLRYPGLHLVANFLGGISTRDRIICGQAAAHRIAAQFRGASPKLHASRSALSSVKNTQSIQGDRCAACVEY